MGVVVSSSPIFVSQNLCSSLSACWNYLLFKTSTLGSWYHISFQKFTFIDQIVFFEKHHSIRCDLYEFWFFCMYLDNEEGARREKVAHLWYPQVVHFIKATSIATARDEIFQRDIDSMVLGICFFLCWLHIKFRWPPYTRCIE